MKILALTCTLGLALAGAAHADQSPAARVGADAIVSHTLDNGLKVVIWPDHDIPNVALYTWFRVGGRNEYPGITGLAHFFEHMMFNGTRTLAPGEFDRTMEAAGGANNAYTSSDVTVYQDWFPKQALDTILDLEADRMANLAFDPKVIESERGVVYSERRSSVDNQPFGALAEQMQATAFVAHPYQFPVIGWPSDVEAWTHDDLKTFFTTYYAPNNAVMFVVGDVEPTAVMEKIRARFAAIPRQPAPRAITTVEPEQQGERRVVVEKPDLQAPMLAMAWHIGNAKADDQAPLQLLQTILTEGDASRLHQRLVEQDQLALGVSGSVDAGFDPGLFWIYVMLPPGADPAVVEKVVDEELARLMADGISEQELAKARKVAEAGFWNGLSTISSKAQALGSHEVFHGDYQALFEAPDKLAKVTRDNVNAAARTRLRATNRTVGVIRPASQTTRTGN
ncbi:MAG TPA: pitrilysin family protein [Chiayiivirga sp.]|nr:pitrilysin family protein [Chiayiivirga sp.]